MTDFVETNALIAVMSDDEDEAKRLLADMLPGELALLHRHADRLSRMAFDAYYEKTVGSSGGKR